MGSIGCCYWNRPSRTHTKLPRKSLGTLKVIQKYCWTYSPWKLTWNLKITPVKKEHHLPFIFQTFIFGFHVSLRGCGNLKLVCANLHVLQPIVPWCPNGHVSCCFCFPRRKAFSALGILMLCYSPSCSLQENGRNRPGLEWSELQVDLLFVLSMLQCGKFLE